ncbi:hypothetical protein KEM52_002505 [Ascosphaera acerosa]|nr:hypothetical protein KEM52_002505 [Ascosphaera acerosa]
MTQAVGGGALLLVSGVLSRMAWAWIADWHAERRQQGVRAAVAGAVNDAAAHLPADRVAHLRVAADRTGALQEEVVQRPAR